jgi:hypothetical protein
MQVKQLVSNYLSQRSMRLHRSRIGWRVAPVYTRYLDRCRKENPISVSPDPAVASAVDVFRRDGATSFWTERTGKVAGAISKRIVEREAAGETLWKRVNDVENTSNYVGDPWRDFPEFADLFSGDLGDFLKGYYGSHFKILYGTLYRSVNDVARKASQLWHSDGGPGICINVMYYLHDTTPANGTLETLPWDTSLKIYEQEKSAERRGELDQFSGSHRDRICAFYASKIEQEHKARVSQPSGKAGLVVPFLNNTLHRGGFPDPGMSRTAIVFHCYPSHQATDLSRYRTKGIAKLMPYPKDPAIEF